MILQFWLPAAAMVALVALVLLRALASSTAEGGEDQTNRRIHLGLLAEVEREIALGRLPPEEGARLRAEAARRLLEAARSDAPPPDQRPTGNGAALAVLAALIGAAAAYLFHLGAPGYPDLPLTERHARAEATALARPSQAQIETAIGPQDALPTDPAEAELLRDLREAVLARPQDAQGQRLLARMESASGNHGAAHAALRRMVESLGPKARAQDHADLAEAMIMAAGGLVTLQAEEALVAALALDPLNGPARYYSGLMLAQIGRPDQAFALWRPLLEGSAPDAPWAAPLREGIEALAQAAGIRYAPPPLQTALPGPDAADLKAAAGLSEAERAERITGMVDGLEARLLAEGGSVPEWARLITSLGVLGENARRDAALTAARAALAGDAQALADLEAAAGAAP